jgi:hypothetical protein
MGNSRENVRFARESNLNYNGIVWESEIHRATSITPEVTTMRRHLEAHHLVCIVPELTLFTTMNHFILNWIVGCLS